MPLFGTHDSRTQPILNLMLDENLYQAGTSCAGTDANKAVSVSASVSLSVLNTARRGQRMPPPRAISHTGESRADCFEWAL